MTDVGSRLVFGCMGWGGDGATDPSKPPMCPTHMPPWTRRLTQEAPSSTMSICTATARQKPCSASYWPSDRSWPRSCICRPNAGSSWAQPPLPGATIPRRRRSVPRGGFIGPAGGGTDRHPAGPSSRPVDPSPAAAAQGTLEYCAGTAPFPGRRSPERPVGAPRREVRGDVVAEYDGDIMNKTRSLAKPLTWLLIIALVGSVGAGALQGIL